MGQPADWASLSCGGSGMPTQMVVLGSESRLAGTTVGQSLRPAARACGLRPGRRQISAPGQGQKSAFVSRTEPFCAPANVLAVITVTHRLCRSAVRQECGYETSTPSPSSKLASGLADATRMRILAGIQPGASCAAGLCRCWAARPMMRWPWCGPALGLSATR